MNLHSSTQKLGRYVTQIIHGINGTKLTFNGIDTESIKQGQFTKMTLKDGRMIIVNDSNVLAVEVFKE
jgi:uncharacterized protein YlzI (FlbEa/FlbD family)